MSKKITLKTLHKATEQEVFDKVAKHLLKQNMKSEGCGACLYRGPSKLKCAAGCLISDSEYSPEMETKDWDLLIIKGVVPEKHSKLIIQLQYIHDINTPLEWREKLIELADKLKFSKKVLG